MKLTQAAERVHKEAEQDKDGHWITWKSAIWLKCGSRVSIRVIEKNVRSKKTRTVFERS